MNRLKQEIQNRKQSKQYIKKSEGIGLGTLALGGLALANRKTISSHIRNIGGKLVRTKGKTKSTPLLEGSKSTTPEVLETPVRNNKPSNTARIQERLQNIEAESPYLQVLSKKKKLTKRERLARAEEIRKIAKSKSSFSQGFVGLIEFGRTAGAKDKKKRRSRVSDIGLGASSIGAIGLGLGSRNSSNIDKKAKDYDAARKAQNIRREMLASQVKSNESPVRSAGLSDMPDKYDLLRRKRNRYRTLMDDAIPGELSQTQVTKNINKDVTRKKRALHKAVKNKKLASYGAIGLAGLSALELGRRGIKKYSNRTKDMS